MEKVYLLKLIDEYRKIDRVYAFSDEHKRTAKINDLYKEYTKLYHFNNPKITDACSLLEYTAGDVFVDLYETEIL